MAAGVSWRRAPFQWAAIALALTAAFLGFDLNHPIVLWDESRVLSNALEMNWGGFSLITTYGWRPDLWNTKPPLAIWLIVACIRLFGTHEWAMRLPTFLASMATAALSLSFAWRLTRNRFTTFCALILLVLSGGFYGFHVGWTADYDAVLTLFATIYLFGLFEALHTSRPKPALVLGCALAVALACLTKGIAGLLPGIGVAIYVVVRRRFPRLFRTPWYAVGALLAMAAVGAYYVERESLASGYLATVMRTELGGRYLAVVGSHDQPILYYPYMLLLSFSAPPALIALFWAPRLKWPNTRAKAFLIYGAWVCAAFMLVLSLSVTKIYWYLAPMYPTLSLITAVSLERVMAALAARRPGSTIVGRPLLFSVAALFAVISVGVKVFGLPTVKSSYESGYGRTFADAKRAGVDRVAVLDEGVKNDEGFVGYTPILHAYAVIWRTKGLGVERVGPQDVRKLAPGVAVATCDERYLPLLHARGANLTAAHGCAAVRIPVTSTTGSLQGR